MPSASGPSVAVIVAAVWTDPAWLTYRAAYTDARAGYLVNINNANLLNVPVDPASQARIISYLDFWSNKQVLVTIPAGAADLALPDVITVNIPGTATIVAVHVMFMFGQKEDTWGTDNKLSGNQYLQVQRVAGAYINAILLPDDLWDTQALTKEGGDAIVGNIDVKAQVNGNVTVNARLASAVADGASLLLRDVQVGLRVYFY